MCSLAAIVSVALGSGNLGASEPDANVVTGTVVKVDVGYLEIDEGKDDGRTNFELYVGDWAHLYKPKVGEKVRVHYRVSRRGKVYADKIEKVGNAEGGSNKR